MTILYIVNWLWDVLVVDSMEENLSGEIALQMVRVTLGILQGFVVYLLSGGFFHHEIIIWEVCSRMGSRWCQLNFV